MFLLVDLSMLITGILLSIKCAHWLVEGAQAIGAKYGFSETGVGLTILALCTSAPALSINIAASVNGYGDFVFANILGANIISFYLVLGLMGIFWPIIMHRKTIVKDLPFSLLIVGLVFVLVNDKLIFGRDSPALNQLEAVVLLVIFVFLQGYIIGGEKKFRRFIAVDEELIKLDKAISFLGIGLVGVAIGGYLVIEGAVEMANSFEVSPRMIALVVLAPGASLPDLATSAVAIRKGRTNMAVGHILGTNLFNLLFILPLSALIFPLEYDYEMNFDLFFYFFGMLLFWVAMYNGKIHKLNRLEAFFFLGFFATYVAFLFVRQ